MIDRGKLTKKDTQDLYSRLCVHLNVAYLRDLPHNTILRTYFLFHRFTKLFDVNQII